MASRDSNVRGVPFAFEKLSVAVGVSEVQTVTLTGGPTGGTWSITFGGATTSAFAIDVSGADVQTALQALASIGTNNATVARTGAGTAGDPYIYTITFAQDLSSSNVAAVSANVVTTLTGGTTPSLTVATSTPGTEATPLTSSEYTYTYGTSPNQATVNADRAVITVEQSSGYIRYRVDGAENDDNTVQPDGMPVSYNEDGHKATDGDVITLDSAAEVANFRALAFTAAATLQVTYFSTLKG